MTTGTSRLLALLALVFASAGCSDTVDPFLDVDRDYTLFGFLDTDTDMQMIRVIPLRRRVDIPPSAPLDATVTLTDLTTGGTINLRDSLVTLVDTLTGVVQPANILIADFRPEMGHTYEIVVQGPEGQRASAQTTVPSDIRPQIGPEGYGLGVINAVTQRVAWPGVAREPFRVEVWYRVSPETEGDSFRNVFIDYGNETGRFENGAWVVEANYTRDRQDVTEFLQVGSLPRLYGVGMKLTYASEDWVPPGGIFDMNALIQPGTFSNVEGGFGFFGSVAQLDVQWALSERARTQLEYLPPSQ